MAQSEKITSKRRDVADRRYDDACGTAFALELLGERWTLLIIRELMFGARRFGQIRAQLPGISANVLAQRLENLETAGVLHRRKLPAPASVPVYELTPWGYESEPIMQTMGRWAVRSPDHDASLPLSPASLMMSMRTMLDAAGAKDLRMTVAFRLADDAFVARVADGRLDIVRGDGDADLIFAGDPDALAGLIYGEVPVTELERMEVLAVTGDRSLIAPFTALFNLPEKFA